MKPMVIPFTPPLDPCLSPLKREMRERAAAPSPRLRGEGPGRGMRGRADVDNKRSPRRDRT